MSAPIPFTGATMPKHIIKRFLPDPHKIRNHPHLRRFGERLHDPNLWHLNRRSVAGAVALGVFLAFQALPMQMVIAAALAILFRVNLPISVIMVWITNPFTMAPIYYTNYWVGTWLLGMRPRNIEFEASLTWLLAETRGIWKPLALGGVVVGGVVALLSAALVRLAWRIYVVRARRRGKPGAAKNS